MDSLPQGRAATASSRRETIRRPATGSGIRRVAGLFLPIRELAGGAAELYDPMLDDDGRIADFADFLQAMGAPESGASLFLGHVLPHQLLDIQARRGIQAIREFIQQHDAGLVDQGPGQGQALPHAARVAVERPIGPVREAQAAKERRNPPAPLSPGHAIECGEEGEVLPARESPEKTAFIARYVADVLSQPVVAGSDGLSAERDGAAIGLQHVRQHAQERCLSRSVGPDDSEDLPRLGGEAHSVEGADLPAGGERRRDPPA